MNIHYQCSNCGDILCTKDERCVGMCKECCLEIERDKKYSLSKKIMGHRYHDYWDILEEDDFYDLVNETIEQFKHHITQRKCNMSLRVWWVPQIPGKPYYKIVDNLKEARLLLDALAEYDDFQFINNITPDYPNTGGLEIYENDEWVGWVSEDGDNFDTYCENNGIKTDRSFWVK